MTTALTHRGMTMLTPLRPRFTSTTVASATVNQEQTMATNKNPHDGHLEGEVKDRSQFQTSSGHWAKRDSSTGQILNVKADPKPFKGVRKEK